VRQTLDEIRGLDSTEKALIVRFSISRTGVAFNPGKECEERDYLVSFFVVSSLDWHVVKHKERGERGETADRMPIL
jgi:hypothetical protein